MPACIGPLRAGVLALMSGTALVSCAVEPIEDLPSAVTADALATTNPEAVRAWLWTMDGDSVRLVHSSDKETWERFPLDYRPDAGWSEGAMVGGSIYPTWWTFSGNRLRGFENGILDHGDHGHIVRPRARTDISLPAGDSIVDLAVSPDRKVLALATASRSGNGSILLLDCLKADTLRKSLDANPRRLAMLPLAWMVVTDSAELQVWSYPGLERITLPATPDRACMDVLADPISGAFWTACESGLFRWKTAARVWESMLPAPDPSRQVRRFLERGRGDLALGLPGGSGACLEHVAIVRLATSQAAYLPVEGACLPGAASLERVDLSADGYTALLADGRAPRLYRIALATGKVDVLILPSIAASVALNWDGTRAWFLSGNKAFQASFTLGRLVDSLPVAPGTTAISLSSFFDNSSLYDSDDHTF